MTGEKLANSARMLTFPISAPEASTGAVSSWPITSAARLAANSDSGSQGAASSTHGYLYRWNRQGRKGQPCSVLTRGKMNSCLVLFEDGFTMVTSRNAIRKKPRLVEETQIEKNGETDGSHHEHQ